MFDNHVCKFTLGPSIYIRLFNDSEQISYKLENERRDKLYGIPAPNAKVDTHELADKVLFYLFYLGFVLLMTDDSCFLFPLGS